MFQVNTKNFRTPYVTGRHSSLFNVNVELNFPFPKFSPFLSHLWLTLKMFLLAIDMIVLE